LKKLILLSLLAAAACSKPAPPAPIALGALDAASRNLLASPQCSKLIPQEWSPSFPVPAGADKLGVYTSFFSGSAGDRKSGFRALKPGGTVSFGSDGSVADCRRTSGTASEIPGSTLIIPGMTLDQVDARSGELYAATESVAALYWAGRPLGPSQKASVADFSRLFLLLANPAHAGDYRALNPDFWSWVEKNGGAAPR
jgi:hypothetical protein